MKLIGTLRSPYTRKCRIVASEKQLEGQLELVTVDLLEKPQFLFDANTLGKVPTLLLDDGTSLIDSTLICLYLDTLGTGNALHPQSASRFPTLNFSYLGEGIIDALIIILREYRRKDMLLQSVVDKNQADLYRTLDYLQATLQHWGNEVTIATVTIGVALCYLDYGYLYGVQFPEWKGRYPQLAGWIEDFSERPSFKATEPV